MCHGLFGETCVLIDAGTGSNELEFFHYGDNANHFFALYTERALVEFPGHTNGNNLLYVVIKAGGVNLEARVTQTHWATFHDQRNCQKRRFILMSEPSRCI